MTTRTRTSVEYEATVEKRAGQQVVEIVRTLSETPVSGRGTEWSKSTRTRTVQAMPVEEAKQLIECLIEAFYFGLDSIDEVAEPNVFLVDTADNVLSEHWSVAEAEQRARTVFEQNSTPDALYVKRGREPIAAGNVISAVTREEALGGML